MKQNLYYLGSTPERVKIIEVHNFGIIKVKNKLGETFFCHIVNLNKVY